MVDCIEHSNGNKSFQNESIDSYSFAELSPEEVC